MASKTFLITIGDRSITGLIARDQMVGPWQVPVSDYGLCKTSFSGLSGEAMASGGEDSNFIDELQGCS